MSLLVEPSLSQGLTYDARGAARGQSIRVRVVSADPREAGRREPGTCPATSGLVSVTRVRGVPCTRALRIARDWLARTGYTPGIDDPPENGLRLSVAGYTCSYRQAGSADGMTRCTQGKRLIVFELAID